MANYTQQGYDPSTHGYWKGTIDGAPNFGYPGNYYFADTMRALFIGFGNFFNEIHVIRFNKMGEPVKTINVPIKFGPRTKSHDFRVEEESGKKYYISLPNLTYRLDSMEFASERAKGIYEQRAFYESDLESAGIVGDMQDQFWSDVQPVPYNFGISMEANCEKMTDAQQIVEQIAVRFQPAAFFDIKEFWFFNKRRSIKLKLNSINWNIESDSMGEEDWRRITVSFNFNMEAVLYKPIKDAQLIERIDTYLATGNDRFIYHASTFGNKDGSLDHKYDFSKIYNTKVGNVYKLDGNPITTHTYDDEGNPKSHFTVYNYIKTDELTTYDADAIQLSAVSSTFYPSNTPLIPSAVPEQERNNYYEKYKFDELTNKFVPVPELVYDAKAGKYVDKIMLTAYSGVYLTQKYYRSMSGIGKFTDDTVTFGHKEMVDEYGNPYSAYYTTYFEDGTFSPSLEEQKIVGTDFVYNVSSYNGGMKIGTTFIGSKFNVPKNINE